MRWRRDFSTMYTVKKSLGLVALILFIGIIILLIYVVSPHTHTKDIGPDYSDRYYELLEKKVLTEEEREELLEEQRKTESKAREEYDSKHLK